MMDRPLQLKSLLWRAEHLYAHKEIITRADDGFRRYSYAEFGRRARRSSNALEGLGVTAGDRVATLAWNTDRHYEAYFAVPCMGAVLHTINVRLAVEQGKAIAAALLLRKLTDLGRICDQWSGVTTGADELP